MALDQPDRASTRLDRPTIASPSSVVEMGELGRTHF
jgi:hypothetical protein